MPIFLLHCHLRKGLGLCRCNRLVKLGIVASDDLWHLGFRDCCSWLVHQLMTLWDAVSDMQLVHLLCLHRLLRKLLKRSCQVIVMRSEKLRTPAKLHTSKCSTCNCIHQAQHHQQMATDRQQAELLGHQPSVPERGLPAIERTAVLSAPQSLGGCSRVLTPWPQDACKPDIARG